MFSISIGSLSLILLIIDGIKACSDPYISIANGCYKIVNGSQVTWSQARQLCANDTAFANGTNSTGQSHLVALENYMERNSLTGWMRSYGIGSEYWIDGIVGTSTWNWSSNPIEWYFQTDERNITGSGAYYKLVAGNSHTGYLISDEKATQELNFICEYQVKANATNNICQNNGTAYTNVGENVCVCAKGFAGETCEIDIDDCSSSPCLHGGNCTDQVNSYTCNCSGTFYEGNNCDTLTSDPNEDKRLAAFWSVLGVVSSLIVLLTISDLPWSDIFTAIGCSCHRLTCCGKQKDSEQMQDNHFRFSDSPTNDFHSGTQGTPISYGSTGTNQPMRQKSPVHVQYNGYRSPDHTQMSQKSNMNPNKNVSFITTNEPRSQGKDPVDSMVNWTQQLQAQLKTKKGREDSASSTKQLIHSTNSYN